jgi:hypothetical protein
MNAKTKTMRHLMRQIRRHRYLTSDQLAELRFASEVMERIAHEARDSGDTLLHDELCEVCWPIWTG